MSAKFRRNHSSAKSGSGFIRILAFAFILLIAIYYLSVAIGNLDLEGIQKKNVSTTSLQQIDLHIEPLVSESTYPVVDHEYFSLGYDEDYEQARWVSYKLTAASLAMPNVDRTDWYTEDPNVKSRSAHHRDYTNSGYTRGHLVPAGDMAFSTEAMETTFHMSNISPQLADFNGGVWRELEELVRDWAEEKDALYIVSGPVFMKSEPEWIGKSSQVAVPDYFFKAIMDENWDAVGFLIPHQLSVESVETYMVSIDRLEEETGLKIFDELLEDAIENDIEKGFDANLWPIDQARYQRRINHWNKR